MSQKKQSKTTGQEKSEPAKKWQDMAEEEAKLTEEPDQMAGLDGVEVSSDAVTAALDEISKKKLTDLTNKLEREMDTYKNDALLAKAEMENLRRRLERDVSNAHKYGSERLIVDLLPVIDSLVLGLEKNQSADSAQSQHQGMELTLDLLRKTLEKNGVSEINPKRGDTFDPALHEAMTMQPDPEAKSNTVLQVLQRGYSLNGRVIRAAMVMVAS